MEYIYKNKIENRQKYKDTGQQAYILYIFTLNAQVNSCCTHTKHTETGTTHNSCSNNQVLHINAALKTLLPHPN